MMLTHLVLVLGSFVASVETTPFRQAIENATVALQSKDFKGAKKHIDRASERDPKSRAVWSLWARWAKGVGDEDEFVYALHRELRLAIKQRAPRAEIETLRSQLETTDPIAPDLLNLKSKFIDKLLPIAEYYDGAGRPHSAIRVHQEILALDPDYDHSAKEIERISAAPDPSLAETAAPQDLMADVSEEWITKHDQKHDTWKTRAILERDNYITHTDAGYEVLVRASEAMEQMNAFYRVFFDYGTREDGRSVPRIDVKIFKNRDEYLTLGSSPVEWSGGQYTGSAVETFISGGGFGGMVGTLFHEAAHQFVDLATSAAGWLNEGLASFFEGCRITANGTVLMNMPANHRLFPLADRMEMGWMTDHTDGIDPSQASTTPDKAPTFRIVLENKYSWGPPWYAPTWGVVFFLYNYQDPVDGRFVYRNAFREFIDASGGRSGEGAVENFEDVVLKQPARRTKGVDFSSAENSIRLPRNVDQLDEVWRDWILELRDEQAGKIEVERPYLEWARHAITRKHVNDAKEFFEKGIVASPEDVEMHVEFATLLADRFKNSDRATKLVLRAIQILERADEVDEDQLEAADALLAKWDPKHRAVKDVHENLFEDARRLAKQYLDQGFHKMAMDVSWRLGSEFGVPGIFDYFEEGVRQSGKSLWLWKLAYNEVDLDGWDSFGNDAFQPEGATLKGRFGSMKENAFDYQFLTLDTITSGDFSMETEVRAKRSSVSFCGLVFGKKSDLNFHSLILFPGQAADPRYGKLERPGYVDLSSFYDAGVFKVWRHNPVDATKAEWHKMRVDVTGRMVDVWFNDELVVTQEFPSLDVLRGSFGLLMGPGEADFRNIRYLARPARDFGAQIERRVRMEKLLGDDIVEGEAPINNSWMDQVPAWLADVKWIQEPLSGWSELGTVPTLLVFWEIRQNKAIPIDGWLRSIAQEYADVGLRVVSVTSPDDAGKIEAYLQEHKFPGSVGVDTRRGRGYGDTFEKYQINRFGTPRVLLMDIDHKVIWEGEPGFRQREPWTPGASSYVDTPVADLVERRQLKELYHWHRKWSRVGEPSLRDGDIESALPYLTQSMDFSAAKDDLVRAAQDRFGALERQLGDLAGLGRNLQDAEAEPALVVALEWRELMGSPVDAKEKKSLKKILSSPGKKAWDRAMKQVQKVMKGMKPGKEQKSLESLVSRLERMQGAIPQSFRSELSELLSDGEIEACVEKLKNAETYPGRWLAREFFRF